MTLSPTGQFVISCRLAIDRITQTEVLAGKGTKRVQATKALYSRPYAIVEKDRIKDPKLEGLGQGRYEGSKRYEDALVGLAQKVTVVFSESSEVPLALALLFTALPWGACLPVAHVCS